MPQRASALRQRLRTLLRAAGYLRTVLRGGFIGLEIAATARAAVKAVTALEAAPRLLMRSVDDQPGRTGDAGIDREAAPAR